LVCSSRASIDSNQLDTAFNRSAKDSMPMPMMDVRKVIMAVL